MIIVIIITTIFLRLLLCVILFFMTILHLTNLSHYHPWLCRCRLFFSFLLFAQ
jgi:hypothetical protein